MLPLWMIIAKMGMKKAENEQDSLDDFNKGNTKDMIVENKQQLPKFDNDINKMFHS